MASKKSDEKIKLAAILILLLTLTALAAGCSRVVSLFSQPTVY